MGRAVGAEVGAVLPAGISHWEVQKLWRQQLQASSKTRGDQTSMPPSAGLRRWCGFFLLPPPRKITNGMPVVFAGFRAAHGYAPWSGHFGTQVRICAGAGLL